MGNQRKRTGGAAREAARLRKKAVHKARRVRSLLILECDATRLAGDGISFAGELAHLTVALAPDATIILVPATSEEELLVRLADCKEKYDAMELVVAVGHANQWGIRLTLTRSSCHGKCAHDGCPRSSRAR